MRPGATTTTIAKQNQPGRMSSLQTKTATAEVLKICYDVPPVRGPSCAFCQHVLALIKTALCPTSISCVRGFFFAAPPLQEKFCRSDCSEKETLVLIRGSSPKNASGSLRKKSSSHYYVSPPLPGCDATVFAGKKYKLPDIWDRYMKGDVSPSCYYASFLALD